MQPDMYQNSAIYRAPAGWLRNNRLIPPGFGFASKKKDAVVRRLRVGSRRAAESQTYEGT